MSERDRSDLQRVKKLRGIRPEGSLAESGSGDELVARLRRRIQQARDEYDLRHYEEAKERLQKVLRRVKALEGDPAYRATALLLQASAQAVLARIRLRLGEGKDVDLLHRAASLFDDGLSPESDAGAQVWSDFGITLQMLGRQREAIQALRNAAERGADSPETYRHLGEALMESEDWEAAERYLRKALELDPDDFRANRNLGRTLQKHGKTEESVEAYRAAAFGAAEAGESRTAIALMMHALELQPDDKRLIASLGDVYWRAGEPIQALEQLDRALRIDPAYAPALGARRGISIRSTELTR